MPLCVEGFGLLQHLSSAVLSNPFATLLLGSVTIPVPHTHKEFMDIQLVIQLEEKVHLYFH